MPLATWMTLGRTFLAVANRELIQLAFVDGKPEQSLIHIDAETGIYIKSRPDWLPDNPAHRPLVDYKTCRSIEPRKLSQDAFAYGYHIQAAMQVDAVRASCV